MLRSYDLDEILRTKMRALLQRSQGRDLFDPWHAWTQSKASPCVRVDPIRVVAAFEDYMRREGTIVTKADYRRSLMAN